MPLVSFLQNLAGLRSQFIALLTIFIVVFATMNANAQGQTTQSTIAGQNSEDADAVELYRPIRTDSPQQTLRSFIQLRGDLEDELEQYFIKKSKNVEDRIIARLLQLSSLVDLSKIAPSSRRDVSIDTVGHLLDVFGRGVLPNILNVPDTEDIEANDLVNSYLIPNSPIRIVRMTEGELAGEFLFSSKTVRTAPEFARAISSIPLDSPLNIESWDRLLPHLTGWMIPSGFVTAIPEYLKVRFLDTPIWKVGLTLIIALAGFVLFKWLYQALHFKAGPTGVRRYTIMSSWPLCLMLTALMLKHFVDYQINLTGTFATFASSSIVVVKYLASAYLLWLLVVAFFEWIILSPQIADQGLNASMLRLLAQFVAIIGSVIVLAFGAQLLGMPVFSILAGLGIGGLAIALAIRPTLENLIGGFILYLDKPVRIGDYCELDGKLGSVERIGIRSTQIRGLDRTLVSIPNALFADMKITNWTSCDEMLIQHTIALRYETDPDQLRHVLARIRAMFLSHPKIEPDTVRVRFVGYGSSSLDVEIRVYAKTNDFNEFFAVREDVLLRIKDIVKESGSSFAFPSMTMYAGQDDGLHGERTERAKGVVESWRQDGRMPFPEFSEAEKEAFSGTLEYPPKGSSQRHPKNEQSK